MPCGCVACGLCCLLAIFLGTALGWSSQHTAPIGPRRSVDSMPYLGVGLGTPAGWLLYVVGRRRLYSSPCLFSMFSNYLLLGILLDVCVCQLRIISVVLDLKMQV